jgi:hypothetical protein
VRPWQKNNSGHKIPAGRILAGIFIFYELALV